ncbi:MAG: hypothetical protein ACLP59_16515 [Bryobacteraceae bacterium]
MTKIAVRDGDIGLGDIQLDLAGCDAPGVSCDWISDRSGAIPDPFRTIGSLAVGQAIVFSGLPSSRTVRRRRTMIVCATAALDLSGYFEDTARFANRLR